LVCVKLKGTETLDTNIANFKNLKL